MRMLFISALATLGFFFEVENCPGSTRGLRLPLCDCLQIVSALDLHSHVEKHLSRRPMAEAALNSPPIARGLRER